MDLTKLKIGALIERKGKIIIGANFIDEDVRQKARKLAPRTLIEELKGKKNYYF